MRSPQTNGLRNKEQKNNNSMRQARRAAAVNQLPSL
jgi:hypothetical protein